jgi:hypothetical protein
LLRSQKRSHSSAGSCRAGPWRAGAGEGSIRLPPPHGLHLQGQC